MLRSQQHRYIQPPACLFVLVRWLAMLLGVCAAHGAFLMANFPGGTFEAEPLR